MTQFIINLSVCEAFVVLCDLLDFSIEYFLGPLVVVFIPVGFSMKFLKKKCIKNLLNVLLRVSMPNLLYKIPSQSLLGHCA